MDRDITVLITGAGAPGAPGIIRSLREPIVSDYKFRIIGTDIELNSSGFGMTDASYLVPRGDQGEFIPEMLKICKKEKVDVVLPLVTSELDKFSLFRREFKKNGITVSISDTVPLRTANNKYQLMSHCKEKGIPTPEFRLVKSYKEFEDAVKELGYPEEAVCFKPPVSNGMRGFRILTEDVDRLDMLMNYKPTDTLATLQDVSPILKNANPFPELLVMEYLPGKEYSVDVFADKDEAIVVVPRTREKVKMGISFVGKTIENKTIIKYARQATRSLNLRGVVGFQFVEREDDVPCVIECNPRLQGTVILSVEAGVNLPYMAVLQALGKEYPVPSEIDWNLTMIRFWSEVYHNE